jgi:hypothetical protein
MNADLLGVSDLILKALLIPVGGLLWHIMLQLNILVKSIADLKLACYTSFVTKDQLSEKLNDLGITGHVQGIKRRYIQGSETGS